MEFTPQETKLIARLRKQDRQWSWVRWGLLAGGLLCAVAVAFYAYTLLSLASTIDASHTVSADTALAIAIFFPKFLLLLAFTGWAFGKAFMDWHGNANRMLLLRLLDAQQGQTPNCENAR